MEERMRLAVKFLSVILLYHFINIFTGCASKAKETETSKGIPVRIAPVVQQKLSSPIHTSGILSSIAEIRLSFKVSGIIEQIYVDEGQKARKGDLLAALNQKEISAKMTQAQSGFKKAQRDLKRVQILYADSVTTLEQMQDAETAVQVAQANVEIAKFNLQHSKIYAPTDGKILKRFVEENELIAMGNPVFIFGSSGNEWIVRVGITDKDIIRVQKKDSAIIKFDAYPGVQFQAYVSEVAESADRNTGTFELEIEIPHSRHRLISGFVAKADIYPSMKRNYHLIPIESLVEAKANYGLVYALRSQNNTTERIPIQIGHVFGDQVAVYSGLEKVSHVITDGAAYLTEGSLVSVVK
jgi:RND family efflux transporter MFP subunit